MKTTAAFSAVLSLVTARSALAQDVPFNPAPQILQIYREQVRPGKDAEYGISAGHTRDFLISTVSVRPGHVHDYAEIRRMIRDAHGRARVGDIHSVYEIDTGMPDGTFLVLTPAGSLEDAATPGISISTRSRPRRNAPREIARARERSNPDVGNEPF